MHSELQLASCCLCLWSCFHWGAGHMSQPVLISSCWLSLDNLPATTGWSWWPLRSLDMSQALSLAVSRGSALLPCYCSCSGLSWVSRNTLNASLLEDIIQLFFCCNCHDIWWISFAVIWMKTSLPEMSTLVVGFEYPHVKRKSPSSFWRIALSSSVVVAAFTY